MSIRIKLTDGEQLEVDVELDDWNRAFQRALQRDAMLEIEDSQGRVLGINPHQVLYLEGDPAEGSARPGEDSAVDEAQPAQTAARAGR
jgi:hypothetical protein